jgi:hypothetical protein
MNRTEATPSVSQPVLAAGIEQISRAKKAVGAALDSRPYKQKPVSIWEKPDIVKTPAITEADTVVSATASAMHTLVAATVISGRNTLKWLLRDHLDADDYHAYLITATNILLHLKSVHSALFSTVTGTEAADDTSPAFTMPDAVASFHPMLSREIPNAFDQFNQSQQIEITLEDFRSRLLARNVISFTAENRQQLPIGGAAVEHTPGKYLKVKNVWGTPEHLDAIEYGFYGNLTWWLPHQYMYPTPCSIVPVGASDVRKQHLLHQLKYVAYHEQPGERMDDENIYLMGILTGD